MKYIYLAVFLLCYTFSLCQSTSDLTIRVVDSETRNPIKSAIVSIKEVAFITKSSDQNGLVYYNEVEKGAINITVVHPNYLTLETSVNVSGISTDDNFIIILRRVPKDEEVLIFGEVSQDEEIDVEGARVEIKIGNIILEKLTDHSGNYDFKIYEKELVDSELHLEVQFKDCIEYSETFNIPRSNILKVDISLECNGSSAYVVTESEILENFSMLSALSSIIEMDIPISLQNHLPKRPGELEIDFQNRSKNFHSEYFSRLNMYLDEFEISNEVYKAHQISLIDSKEFLSIKSIYGFQESSFDYIKGLRRQVQHLLDLDYDDSIRAQKMAEEYRLKVIDSRVNYLLGMQEYLRTAHEEMHSVLELQLSLMSNFDISSSNTLNENIIRYIKKLLEERNSILRSRISTNPVTNKDCERIVRDPYLIYLRRLNNKPDTLSFKECQMIKQNLVDSTISNYEELIWKATESYVIGDGTNSLYYYQKMLALDTISSLLRDYSSHSIDRLIHPEKYAGSLGIMILKLTDDNGFDQAGLEAGDIVFKVNGKVILDPENISRELINSNGRDSLVEFYRDNKILRAVIKESKQAGAQVSPLISFYMTQL